MILRRRRGRRRRARRRERTFGLWLGALGLPAAAADGDVAEDAAFGPVTAAAFTEVARLREVVVIVVAELRVERITTRTLQRLLIVVIIIIILVVVWPDSSVSAAASAAVEKSTTATDVCV